MHKQLNDFKTKNNFKTTISILQNAIYVAKMMVTHPIANAFIQEVNVASFCSFMQWVVNHFHAFLHYK